MRIIWNERLTTRDLELINEYIEHYRKTEDQENIIKLEHQIMTRRYFRLLEVKRNIRTKISLHENNRRTKNHHIKAKALLKRWHEFDDQYIEK